jgi:single-strand DNA-binding protein
MQATLLGRLGRDAELKQFGSKDCLKFSVADDIGFGDKKVTQWVNCTLWGPRASKVRFEKGTQLLLWGELTLREYETKEGKKGSSLELNVSDFKFVGGKKESEAPLVVDHSRTQALPSYSEAPLQMQMPRQPVTASSYAGDDDDIPF